MIYPPLLAPGDCVGIVAPGKKVRKDVVESAVQILRGLGLAVKLGDHLFSEMHHYFAGSDEERRQDLQSMIDDPSVKAIFAARGGYGSTRVVDQINIDSLRRAPKWIIGFSDITAIHLKLLAADIASVHGLMPVLFSDNKYASSLESLKTLLFTGAASLAAKHQVYNRVGDAQGIVVGGNLSLLTDSLGTQTEIQTRNRILIIEEVDEYRYRVDRMFTQLKRAGKLEALAGLVLGHFTDIKETETGFGETEYAIIANAVKDYQYPVAFGFGTGHDNPNEAWIHGGHASLTVSDEGSGLQFEPIKSGTV